MEKIDKNKRLKEKFLEYYKEVPVQKYGAAYIGVHEDTIIDWKKSDSDFSNQVEEAKAMYLRTELKEVKSREWKIERLFKDHFAPPKQEVENTGTIEVVFKRK